MKYLSSSLLVLVVASFFLVGATTTVAATHPDEQQGIVKCGTKKVDGDGNPIYIPTKIKYDCDEKKPDPNGTCQSQKGSTRYACQARNDDGGNCVKLIQAENPPCGFSDLGNLILDITQKIIYQFAPLLVILMIAFGGFIILLAREDPGMYQKGIQVIKYALIGYVIVLLSFLIVETFLKVMGVDVTYGWKNITEIFGG